MFLYTVHLDIDTITTDYKWYPERPGVHCDVWSTNYSFMWQDTLFSAHITTELSQMVFHVQSSRVHSFHSWHIIQSTDASPCFSFQLMHNASLSSSSCLEFSGMFFTLSCFQGLIQAKCFLCLSLVFTFQGIFNFKCCIYGQPVLSSDLSSSFHGMFVFGFQKGWCIHKFISVVHL
jgi:hypothetical protein